VRRGLRVTNTSLIRPFVSCAEKSFVNTDSEMEATTL
jgi:hypothetical protein